MGSGSGVQRGWRMVTALVAASLALVSCTSDTNADEARPAEVSAPAPSADVGRCRTFTVAYDPAKGYEASAFVVGGLAESQLGCRVTYVETSSRNAWRLVARGDADVYMDAYGVRDLRRQYAGPDGAVTVVGPNGVRGGVDFLTPFFMGQRGLGTARDLGEVDSIGWGPTTPAITTVPELLRLAHAVLKNLGLEDDYVLRDYAKVAGDRGMSDLIQQPRDDNEREKPNVYLVAGPLAFLGDGPGQQVVDIPESSAEGCRFRERTTLCSLHNFDYLKIVNSEFARSGSPAYNLVYNYRLTPDEAANLLEIAQLSGYDVGPADVASWINTHEHAWQRWLN